ncbi:DTW domain-containing protein [Pseudoalteromonas sp. MMG010]|uniref:tRNA-uridine aminocarboxypropyltransferase n=1 Tax=Pseudoalteromonas sp. MMG010 TaxID=2822685 RepID=UPI001B3A5389|nr:tRNA-uridine aminocarboxypropyltransferase [Pseudoalteromonas sp. MMG010]MBQ4832577.1 DTW domain-containing protein [Pseudoalteromonas sp. MMG010]
MARALCQHCEFAINTCICHAITAIKNPVHVIVLQHPSETKVTKNTAKLLNLSLSHCEIVIGENSNDFNAVLNNLPTANTVLLYPNENSKNIDNSVTLEKLPTITHLIVIDGTWKKAYKIFQLTTQLQRFTCISFNTIPKNQYRIRKAPRIDSLSTLEAVAHSLFLISNQDPAPLYKLLQALNHQQTKHMPEHVKARYLD